LTVELSVKVTTTLTTPTHVPPLVRIQLQTDQPNIVAVGTIAVLDDISQRHRAASLRSDKWRPSLVAETGFEPATFGL
jgi:hypothetical protein